MAELEERAARALAGGNNAALARLESREAGARKEPPRPRVNNKPRPPLTPSGASTDTLKDFLGQHPRLRPG